MRYPVHLLLLAALAACGSDGDNPSGQPASASDGSIRLTDELMREYLAREESLQGAATDADVARLLADSPLKPAAYAYIRELKEQVLAGIDPVTRLGRSDRELANVQVVERHLGKTPALPRETARSAPQVLPEPPDRSAELGSFVDELVSALKTNGAMAFMDKDLINRAVAYGAHLYPYVPRMLDEVGDDESAELLLGSLGMSQQLGLAGMMFVRDTAEVAPMAGPVTYPEGYWERMKGYFSRPSLRESLVKLVQGMGPDAAPLLDSVAPLIADPELRIEAIRALGAMGPAARPRASLLGPALEDSSYGDESPRVAAAVALFSIGGPEAAKIRGTIAEMDADERQNLFEQLLFHFMKARHAPPRADDGGMLVVVRKAMDDPDGDVRSKATACLAGFPDAEEAKDALLGKLRSAGSTPDENGFADAAMGLAILAARDPDIPRLVVAEMKRSMPAGWCGVLALGFMGRDAKPALDGLLELRASPAGQMLKEMLGRLIRSIETS